MPRRILQCILPEVAVLLLLLLLLQLLLLAHGPCRLPLPLPAAAAAVEKDLLQHLLRHLGAPSHERRLRDAPRAQEDRAEAGVLLLAGLRVLKVRKVRLVALDGCRMHPNGLPLFPHRIIQKGAVKRFSKPLGMPKFDEVDETITNIGSLLHFEGQVQKVPKRVEASGSRLRYEHQLRVQTRDPPDHDCCDLGPPLHRVQQR
mmetsp:Transcript_100213/g.261856  ORF Transcript_100213/g.261856 Transcript_100213/m.261856 type:complete len:202 (-) Transcript_100213:207-812(-)